MNKKTLFALWGGLFLLCAGLGFISEPTGVLKALMVILSVAFFVPGLLLIRAGGRNTLKLVRNLAIASLALTLVLLIGNFLSIAASETVGTILYNILIVVSCPMVCGQYWALSLFLWAYLMIAAMTKLKKK